LIFQTQVFYVSLFLLKSWDIVLIYLSEKCRVLLVHNEKTDGEIFIDLSSVKSFLPFDTLIKQLSLNFTVLMVMIVMMIMMLLVFLYFCTDSSTNHSTALLRGRILCSVVLVC